MDEAIGAVGGGVAIGRSIVDFLNAVRRVRDTNVISALFDSEGNRIHGSDKIQVEVHKQEDEGVWWYEVQDLDTYAFVRFPVTASGIVEVIGMIAGGTNPDARFWRWVAQTLPGRIYGGGEPPNAEVDFVVVGYRPVALVKHFSGGSSQRSRKSR